MRIPSLSRSVLKAIGLFGGVQVTSIVCSIVRAKLVALWIGPVGVGLFGLWNMALDTISGVTQLGIRDSAVRGIAEHSGSSRAAAIAIAIRRWSVLLGAVGALITLILAPWLSMLSFGDHDHAWGFVLLSIAVMMQSLTSGEHAILQGSHMLKRLAQAQTAGLIAGLIISIPLYYYFGEESVLPSVVICSTVATIAAFCRRNRTIAANAAPQPFNETMRLGKQFITFGVALTLAAFTLMLGQYLFVAYLNHAAGTHEVGLFQAGNTIVTRYCGLILSALGVEYYPRLASVCRSAMRTQVYVALQMRLTLALLLPVVVLMMLLREPVLILLYSREFLPAEAMMSWSLMGSVMRAVSWCLAFTILARGDSRIYIITETASCIIGLALNISGYYLAGLQGVGISQTLWYTVYTIMIAFIYYRRYRLQLPAKVIVQAAVTIAVVATLAALL